MLENIYLYISSLIDKVNSSIFRIGYPRTRRDKTQAMVQSLFLHIHPAKVHKNTLRPTYTLGLGLISFYLFIILAVTGVLLMFYYVPSLNEAYGSMKDLEFVVTFGILLRNMHRWAAHGMVITVFLHMCRVFYTGSYKRPREFNWIIGVLLFLLTLFLSFTGYLLPWDQLAFWAITVGTNIARYAPIIGEKIQFLLLGGNIVGQNALLRFYTFHIAVLPLAMAILIALHFWRIRKDGGLSRPVDELKDKSEWQSLPEATSKTYGLMAIVKGKSYEVDKEPEYYVMSWPHLLVRELVVFMAVLVVLLSVSIFFNAPLEELANPTHPTNPAKAPWYFLGLQELVSHSAFIGGVLVPAVMVLFLLALPYIDRNPKGVGVWFSRQRRFAVIIFTIFAIVNILLIIIGLYFRGPNWSFILPWKS